MKTLVHVSKGCIQAATHRRDCHINEVESLTYYEVGEAEAFAWSLLDAVEVMRGREEWKANNPDGKCTGNIGRAGPECDRCERWKWDCEGRGQWHVKH